MDASKKLFRAIMLRFDAMRREEYEESRKWWREQIKRDEEFRALLDATWEPGPKKKKLLATLDRTIKTSRKALDRPFKPFA